MEPMPFWLQEQPMPESSSQCRSHSLSAWSCSIKVSCRTMKNTRGCSPLPNSTLFPLSTSTALLSLNSIGRLITKSLIRERMAIQPSLGSVELRTLVLISTETTVSTGHLPARRTELSCAVISGPAPKPSPSLSQEPCVISSESTRMKSSLSSTATLQATISCGPTTAASQMTSKSDLQGT